MVELDLAALSKHGRRVPSRGNASAFLRLGNRFGVSLKSPIESKARLGAGRKCIKTVFILCGNAQVPLTIRKVRSLGRGAIATHWSGMSRYVSHVSRSKWVGSNQRKGPEKGHPNERMYC